MCYRDELPPHPTSVPNQEHQHNPAYQPQAVTDGVVVPGGSEGPLGSPASVSVLLVHHTCPNSYGIHCIYPVGEPSYSPDEHYSLDSVFNPAPLATDSMGIPCPWWALSHSSETI
jgi:hypothetical protein